MARRDILEQCRGMDQDYYFYGEDSDLCYRIWQQGWKISYLPDSVKMIHHGGISSTINLFDNNQRQKHLMGWKSRFLFIKKHYPLWRRFLILLAVCGALGANAVIYGLASFKRRDLGYLKVNFSVQLDIAKASFQVL